MLLGRLTFLFSSVVLYLKLCHGYLVDDRCSSTEAKKIDNAVDEALRMAEYAAWRIGNDNKNVGMIDQLIEKMLGKTSGTKDALVARLKKLRETVGPKTPNTAGSPLDVSKDKTVLFRCGERAIKPIPGYEKATTKEWYDESFLNNMEAATYDVWDDDPKKRVACCMPKDFAVTMSSSRGFDDTDKSFPHSIIYICERSLDTKEVAPLMGGEWYENEWSGQSIGESAKFLSTTILHELLHAQTGKAFGKALPGTLPSGRKEEYNYARIALMRDDDKFANAEGYTLVASALWLSHNRLDPALGVIGPDYNSDNGDSSEPSEPSSGDSFKDPHPGPDSDAGSVMDTSY